MKGKSMKHLLATTAVIEVGTGLLLVSIPSTLTTLLLGSSLDISVGSTVARVAGVALIALAIACWLARCDVQSRAARGLVGAMTFHNAGLFAVLLYAGLGLGLKGIGFWIVIFVHAALFVWCVLSLLKKSVKVG
jgi:hypothetical protein